MSENNVCIEMMILIPTRSPSSVFVLTKALYKQFVIYVFMTRVWGALHFVK